MGDPLPRGDAGEVSEGLDRGKNTEGFEGDDGRDRGTLCNRDGGIGM